MYSGWDERVKDAKAFINMDGSNTMHFPGFSAEAAAFLARERDVIGIGVDTISLDPGKDKEYKAHKAHYDFQRLDLLDSTPSCFRELLTCNHIHHNAENDGSEESTAKQKMCFPFEVNSLLVIIRLLCFGTTTSDESTISIAACFNTSKGWTPNPYNSPALSESHSG